MEYYNHRTLNEVRMQVRDTDIVFERQVDAQWRQHEVLPLPIKSNQAAVLQRKYGLPREVVQAVSYGR